MKNRLWKIFHRIAHSLSWNKGLPESWWQRNEEGIDELWAGFRCECGKLEHAHIVQRKVVKSGT